jgi:hypothetical protein
LLNPLHEPFFGLMKVRNRHRGPGRSIFVPDNAGSDSTPSLNLHTFELHLGLEKNAHAIHHWSRNHDLQIRQGPYW